MRDSIIAPSLLSADFSRLKEEAAKCVENGADWLHMDIMDGHFVDNLTIGPVVIQSLRKNTESFIDCHLMVTHPQKWLDMMKTAGADNFTFHYETVDTEHIKKFIKQINNTGMKCSIAIKPDTNVNVLLPLLDDDSLDIFMILIMTVHPGFGGQKFMSSMMEKVELLHEKYPSLNIQVDGGLSEETIGMASKAGANVIVAGSAIFKANDMKKTIALLRKNVDDYLINEKTTNLNPTPKKGKLQEEINIDELLYSPVVPVSKNIF